MHGLPRPILGGSLRSDPVGHAATLALLTALYFAAGKAGLALALVHTNASAVWPPTGMALAAVLLFGNRVWPAIFVGAFLVNLTTAGTVATSIAIASGNTIEALIGGVLVVRFAGGRHAFERARNIVRFVLVAAVLATAVSATIGTSTLALAGLAPRASLGAIWLTWWLGDAAGALVVAPVLVLAVVEPRPGWSLRKTGEAVLLFGGAAVVAAIVFRRSDPPPFMFACVPFPLWAAFRFGRREAALATLLMSAFAVWGTLPGLGPFALPSANESLLLLQVFMGGLSAMNLVVASIVAGTQQAEHELRVAHQRLEATVAARTEALSEAVRALEHEVAERRRAEHGLRGSEIRLRGLLAAAPDAMVVVDGSGTIVELSAQTEALFGFERHELLGRPVELLVPAGARARHGRHRKGFSEDPRTRPMGEGLELNAVRRDGTEFPVEISLSPVTTDEGVLVMAAIRDITERKQVEVRIRRLNVELERRVRERTAELERSNEALKQFAYATSHDLREPLRTMGNYAELLARRYKGRLDEEADLFLGFIVDGAAWMHLLLEGLLAYSSVRTPSPVIAPANMNRALEQALGNLGAAIAETRARVTSATLPDAPADDLQMVQVFQNLVGNAIKFRRPDVAPEVRVEATRRESEWVFAVRDNGIGIDLRHKERVFALFQRLNRRQEYPGAGIGLAICRRIVELHHGRIWVEAPPEGGAAFLFTLPTATQETA